MYFVVTLTLTVEAKSVDESYEMGAQATEHLLDTFNDNGSIHPLVEVSAEPAASQLLS
jgi:flagellar biosynthesis regulator FlbT